MNKLYKNFLNDNKQAVRKYINNEYNPIIKEMTYKKYLTDSNLKEYLKDIIKSNEKVKVLVVAIAGAGKTYLISDLYDDLDYCNRKYLCCPNKIQAEQNAKYNFKSLIAGENILNTDKKISSVYDKANEILNSIDTEKDIICIDECHSLAEAINYRKNCIDTLEKISNICNKVIYITATPSSLILKEFTHIIFIDNSEKGKVDKINLIETESVLDKTINILNNKKQKYMISYNNKKDLTLLKKHFNDIDIITRDSRDDDVYKEIVNNEELISNRILFTSVLNAGTNIKSAKGFDLKEIDVYNMIAQNSFFSITDSIQMFNRNRVYSKSWNLVFNKKKKALEDNKTDKYKMRSLLEILDGKMIEIKHQITFLNKIRDLLLIKNNKLNRKETYEQIQYFLNFKNLDGVYSNSLGCIEVDENLEFYINYNALMCMIYKKYNLLLAMNKDVLIDLLSDFFKVKVEKIEEQLLDETVNNIKEEKKQVQEELKDRCFKNLFKYMKYVLKILDMEELDKKKYIDKQTSEVKEALYELELQNSILSKFREAVHQVDIEEAIKIFKAYNKIADINKILFLRQVIELNKIYKKTNDINIYNSKNTLIIKYLVLMINKHGKRITKRDIEKIREFALTNKLCDKISNKKIMYFLNVTFNISKDNKISSLRIK